MREDNLPMEQYYAYCEDCGMNFDYWKDDQHEGHKIRFQDPKYLFQNVMDCDEMGCLETEDADPVIEERRQKLIAYMNRKISQN